VDWRVSLYTWTKGLAAGAYLVPLLLVVFGVVDASSALWQWVAPVVAGAFLAATGLLLIWTWSTPRGSTSCSRAPDAQLAREGGWIISGYAMVLAAHFIASLARAPGAQTLLMLPGVPLAAGAAVYTAYLFAQAKARDLWQSPLLAPHLLVQALLAGAAVVLVAGADEAAHGVGRWVLGARRSRTCCSSPARRRWPTPRRTHDRPCGR